MSNITSTVENQTVINTPLDHTNLEEILEYISNNINSWADKNVIWDLHKVDFDSITTNDIRVFIANSHHFNEKRIGFKTAAVTPTDLGFGMMRMLTSIAEIKYDFKLNVFRTVSEAKDWVDGD